MQFCMFTLKVLHLSIMSDFYELFGLFFKPSWLTIFSSTPSSF